MLTAGTIALLALFSLHLVLSNESMVSAIYPGLADQLRDASGLPLRQVHLLWKLMPGTLFNGLFAIQFVRAGWGIIDFGLFALYNIFTACVLRNGDIIRFFPSSLTPEWADRLQSEDVALICSAMLQSLFLLSAYRVIHSGSSSLEDQKLRRKLEAYLGVHDPSRISEVSKLVRRYRGREEELFYTLNKKYKTGEAVQSGGDSDAEEMQGEDLMPKEKEASDYPVKNYEENEERSEEESDEEPIKVQLRSQKATSQLVASAITAAREEQQARIKERIAKLQSGKK